MRNQFTLRVLAVLLVSMSSVAFLAAKGGVRHRDTTTPVVLGMDPSNPGQNTNVTFTIQMSGSVSSDTDVAIGCTNPSAFTNLPTDVVVTAGNSQATFQATTSSTSGYFIVAATANGGTALAYPH
ncbi:MAG TPA: hypothetical protein VHE55_14595 [Fimbriimonadaceae bacterium]|nr:hypothetical protein [Fimbriimonadaceae bacterium]